MPTLLPLHRLRHPNVMTDAERHALPDPRRPIDAPSDMVNHAWQDWLQYELSGTATWQAADFGVYDHDNATHDTKTRADTSDDGLPYHTLANMLHDQRALTQAAADPYAWRLPLAWLPVMVARFDQTLFNTLWQTQPDAALWLQAMDGERLPSELPPDYMTWRLLVAKHRYPVMLCVWALCQCRTRQSVNPHATLQALADALTTFAADHRQALRALSCERDWQILPSHVELALFAMGVHMTKPRGHDIGSRRSAIAAHSPLMF
ncbi:hypothetical protein [Faucicola atlantae]|uniref:Uncharacterized protein n=1 Tax=Faucicola atlantae TaxID=34059 RepID=A0A1B8QGU8_9GAMM|nr:hypothetical protein [Moraxella atlantae]OBX82333.1 hypothetical protein A9306_00325 [Moraxella atlantae]